MWRTRLAWLAWSGIAVCLLVGLVGGRGAAADTGDPTAPLYRPNGTIMGSVSMTGTQVTVTVQNGIANTTYAVCITLPLLQQQGGAGCITVSSLGLPGTVAVPCVTLSGLLVPVCLPFGLGPSAVTCIPIMTPFGLACLPGGLFAPSFTLLPATGSLATDATGAGSVTLVLPSVPAVSILQLTRTTNPGDTAQAVIVAGAG